MDNLTAKQKASKKYYEQNKDYYNNYYREYRKKHKPKNYAKIYKNRLDKIKETLYCWGEALQPEFQQKMLQIIEGEHDEKI